MGGNNSSEQERVPQLSAEQQAKIAQWYGNQGLQSYDHPVEGYIMNRDMGNYAYDDIKHAEASQKLGSAKSTKVKAATNDAYILPKTIKIENSPDYVDWKVLKFDYKINVNATVVVTLAGQPHKPDQHNPFEYEPTLSHDLSSKSYMCDVNANGKQNTISFTFKPTDFQNMSYFSNQFYPCLIHIYAHYEQGSKRQNENFVYCSFGQGMNSINLERNMIRMDGKTYEMNANSRAASDTSIPIVPIYGMTDSDGSNVCLVCLDNPRNMVLKPWNHMCLCDVCAEPMLHSGQKCPVCRGNIEELEKIDIVIDPK